MGGAAPEAVAVVGEDARSRVMGTAVPDQVPTHRPRPADQSPVPAPEPPVTSGDLFARYTRSYVAERAGRPVAVLHAGAVTATSDLGIPRLREEGAVISVAALDDDTPGTRAAVAGREDLSTCTLGDLRTLPLPPRTFDIVYCPLLLGRIRHAELVLDRLLEAIKPGGLLLLSIRDRDCAAGFLDRVAPRAVQGMIERSRRGERAATRHPAIYERLSSARGVHSYALLRGLVVAERAARGGSAGDLPPGPRGFLAAQTLVAAASRGRLSHAHEELLYVLRKPENRFARLL